MRVLKNLVIAFAGAITLWLVGWAGLFSVVYAICYEERHNAKTFTLRHTYRPLSGAYEQVELQAEGNIIPGGDNVVSDSTIDITLTRQDGQTFTKSLRFSYDGLFVGDETYVRVSATPDALVEWIASLPVDCDADTLRAEAAELSQLVANACRAYSPTVDPEHFAWIAPWQEEAE